jgi:hypothetical protein
MEQLKVRKKDTIILNVVIYLCLSFFFLYIQHAYRHHLAPFSLVYLKKGIELFWYVALSLICSVWFIWRHHKYCLVFYQFSVILVGFKVLEGLFIEFNKIIVVAMFFYVTISYFLYQLLKHYLNLASINQNYQSSDLFDPLLRKIPCSILYNEQEWQGHLTNWDNEGCFIKLDLPKKLTSKVRLKIQFADREFVQNGEVVAATLDLSGVGIKFNKSVKDLSVFNWAEFMEIVHELGFQPERLR